MKKCRICKEAFEPVRPLQTACSMECAIGYANRITEKKNRERELEDRRELKARKEKLKTLSDHAKDAQKAVNAYVRARDEGLPCITCGTTNPIQWHAGHYLTRGAHPELALDPMNINRQCSQCNDHGSGRQLDHRKGILDRYGQSRLDYLEAPHPPKRYRIEDYKAITAEFKQKLKDLQQGRKAA